LSKHTISTEQAYKILRVVAQSKVKWGKQASPPYTMATIMEALELVSADGGLDPELKANAAEMTKLRRQLAACQNREKARNGKLINLVPESDESAT
jgi:hypothetical protein